MKKVILIMLSFTAICFFGCSAEQNSDDRLKATVLAENLDHPSALTVDGKFIYFVTGGTLASLREGKAGVWKMSVEGGQPVRLFQGFQKDSETVVIPDVFVLATDEKFVYFSAGHIYRVLKEGGNAEQIIAGKPTEMALDEENIYWHNFAGEGMKDTPLYTVDKKGGEMKKLTEPANISGISVDREFVFWSQPDGIYKMSKKTAEKSKIYQTQAGKLTQGMTSDGNSLYFLEADSLFSLSKNGKELSKITANVNNAYKFYVDEENVYFVKNEGSFGLSLNKVSKTGNGENTKIYSGYLKHFALGDKKIYFSDVAKIYEIGKM